MGAETSAFRLWLGTGRRRRSLLGARGAAMAFFLLLFLGPSAVAAPLATSATGTLPAQLVGPSLHPSPVARSQAERELGMPLLDAPALHRDARDLGLWLSSLEGPYGHTVLIFHVFSTAHQTWRSVMELRTARPMDESPWEIIIAQPTTVAGHPARLYQQPGSITLAWQETPTLHVSVSEDSQLPRALRGAADWSAPSSLDQAALMELAAALRPRGFQVGPFRLGRPW